MEILEDFYLVPLLLSALVVFFYQKVWYNMGLEVKGERQILL